MIISVQTSSSQSTLQNAALSSTFSVRPHGHDTWSNNSQNSDSKFIEPKALDTTSQVLQSLFGWQNKCDYTKIIIVNIAFPFCLLKCFDVWIYLTLPDGVQVRGTAFVGGAARHQLSPVGVEVNVTHRLRHAQSWEEGNRNHFLYRDKWFFFSDYTNIW